MEFLGRGGACSSRRNDAAYRSGDGTRYDFTVGAIIDRPPKRCGVSFVIRVAEGVDPYGYAASYPPPPPKRCDISFVGGRPKVAPTVIVHNARRNDMAFRSDAGDSCRACSEIAPMAKKINLSFIKSFCGVLGELFSKSSPNVPLPFPSRSPPVPRVEKNAPILKNLLTDVKK